MNNRIIKIAIAVVLFVFAVYQFTLGNIWWGLLFVLLTAIVVITLFWHEVHILALFHMRRNKFESAEKALTYIKHPEKLPKTQEAFHYFMLGNVESSKRNIGKAETWYKRALSTGLRMKTNQAIAKLNLAVGSLSRRRKREAQMYLQDVKKLDKYNVLKDQVKFVEQQMKKM
jgi:hypothetical protein